MFRPITYAPFYFKNQTLHDNLKLKTIARLPQKIIILDTTILFKTSSKQPIKKLNLTYSWKLPSPPKK